MGTYKGSERASIAAKRAHLTRRANKLKFKEDTTKEFFEPLKKALDKKLNEQMIKDKVQIASIANIKVAKTELVKVEELDLNKLKDTEAYVFRTNGPTKITYSHKYMSLRISPLCTILTEKQ